MPLASLAAGDPCPKCDDGTVYETGRPGVLVRLTGQPPIGAKIYYLQKLRCNLCGAVFTAETPECACREKYDATAGSMIALLKYGTGMPFNRSENLQGGLGVPLPASTQWDIVEALAERAEPAFEELVRQAAQGDVVHNDDTTVKILELMGERARQEALAEDSAGARRRKSRSARAYSPPASCRHATGCKIALFLSGRQHAGENLKDVLRRRAVEIGLAHPDVRCVIAKCARRIEDDSRQLFGRTAAVRGGGGAVSRRMPPRVRVAFRGLP